MNSEFCDLFPVNTYYLVKKQNIAFSGKVVDCDPFENTVELTINDGGPIIDNNGDTIGIGETGIFNPKVWKFQKIGPYISTKRLTHTLTARSARTGGKKKRTKRNRKSKRRRL